MHTIPTKILTAVILLVASTAGLRAQDEPVTPAEQIWRNRGRLKVSIAMDRAEYLPGEIIELKISVQNPTSETLRIPDPFSRQTGEMEYWQRVIEPAGSEGTYQRLASEPYAQPIADPIPMPTIAIAPGEIIVQKFHSYDEGILWQMSVSSGAASRRPGEYRLSYWSAQADFRVVAPLYEGMVKIPWPEWDEHQTGYPDYKVVRAQKYLYAVVLSVNGKHFICLDKEPYSGRVDTPRADSDGRLIYQEFQLYRYSRVAESDAPIVSLKGKSDELGRIQLNWGAVGEGKLFIDRSDSILTPSKPTK